MKNKNINPADIISIEELSEEYRAKLAEDFGMSAEYVDNIIRLIEEGNTLPFIARYRKELTGSTDDVTLRKFASKLEKLRAFAERKYQICALIEKQGKLTRETVLQIKNAETLQCLEDIYLPFKPKKRTKASIARDNGLQPLADIFIGQSPQLHDIIKICTPFLSPRVKDVSAAADGAVEILAETFSENLPYRKFIRDYTLKNSLVYSSLKKRADKNKNPTSKKNYDMYSSYSSYSEKTDKIPNHRILLLLRGEREGFLSLKIKVDTEAIYSFMRRKIIKENSGSIFSVYLEKALKASYTRFIAPCIEREIFTSLRLRAEKGAVSVFEKNLKALLMQPPLRDKVILGVDPGYRNGCKTAAVDKTGKLLYAKTIYPDFKSRRNEQAEKIFLDIVDKFSVDIVAIGNGTAAGETEVFVSQALEKYRARQVKYTVVSEAGASVYSASELAAEELPQLDVTLRGAVSIARRLQDNMAELVKISPYSIGVGQYQHDISIQFLNKALSGAVESCVNSVGVDVNTASVQLLSYVSGITPSVGRNIVRYRERFGRFKCREELKKVEKLGSKAFQQSAGFLRVFGGLNSLDETSIHPESYKTAELITRLCCERGIALSDAEESDEFIRQISKLSGCGLPTIKDILSQLLKPGYDIRNNFETPHMRSRVFSIEDLTVGSVVYGTVRNVTDFGAFVDIGVHQDGLLHISEISEDFVSDIGSYLKTGDRLKLKITQVDMQRKRISLSVKEL